jgi:hypothetical protein
VVWSCLLAIFVADTCKHALLLFADPQPPIMDARDYWDLGTLLAKGDWWWQSDPIAFRTPAYPALLACCQVLFGKHAMMFAITFQHLCVMATSITTAWVCGRLTQSGWAAVAAYGLSAACISRAWSANLLLTETVFTLALTLLLAADVCYRQQPSAGRSLLVGLILGITTMVRPVTSLLWVPLVVSWIPFRPANLSLRGRLGHIALMVSVSFLLLVPWYARNWSVFGEPFLTSFLGRNIWTVTFQDGSGAGLALSDSGPGQELQTRVRSVDQDVAFTDTWGVSNALRDSGLNDNETDKLMVQACLQANRSQPAIVAYKAIRRTVNFWRCVANPFPQYLPTAETESLQQIRWNSPFLADQFHTLTNYVPSRSLPMNELFLLAILIGTVILCLDPRLRTHGFVLALTLLYFNLITAAVEIPAYRYRMILEPVMIMIVVCAFTAGRQRMRRTTDVE